MIAKCGPGVGGGREIGKFPPPPPSKRYTLFSNYIDLETYRDSVFVL